MKSPYRVKPDGPLCWNVEDVRSGQVLKRFITRDEARKFKAELDGRVAAARKAEQPPHAEITARR